MDWGEILLSLVFNLVVTVFFYLLVPVIFCVRKKSFTKKQINKIVFINGAVVWFIFRILTLAINGEPSSGATVLLWSAVAYWLLKKNCLKEAEDEKESASKSNVAKVNATVKNSDTSKTEDNVQMSLSPKGETPKKYGNYNIYGADVRFNPEGNRSIQEKKTVQTAPPPPKASRYCSLCGGKINDVTKQCTQCGKQYFKGFTKTEIALIVVSVLLIISIIINIVQAIDIEFYKDVIHQLRNQY